MKPTVFGFQTYGSTGTLRLRIRLYQDGIVKNIPITKRLIGVLRTSHFSQKNKRFVPSAPNSDKNNEFLDALELRAKQVIESYPDATLDEIFNNLSKFTFVPAPKKEVFVGPYILEIVNYLYTTKNNGTYNEYRKVYNRLKEFDPFLDTRPFDHINKEYCYRFCKWINQEKKGSNYNGSTKMLRAVLGRAADDEFYDLNLISGWKASKYKPVRDEKINVDILTYTQRKKFLENKEEICSLPSKFSYDQCEFMYDICCWMLHTYMAVIDIASIKYTHIHNGRFEFKRAKLKHQTAKSAVSLPITKEMRELMEKYRDKSRDGYIFPIRTARRAKILDHQRDIIPIRCDINEWLKEVGRYLKTTFPLYMYALRHTAISYSYVIDRLDPLTIAKRAGSDISNVIEHYGNERIDDRPITDMMDRHIYYVMDYIEKHCDEDAKKKIIAGLDRYTA